MTQTLDALHQRWFAKLLDLRNAVAPTPQGEWNYRFAVACKEMRAEWKEVVGHPEGFTDYFIALCREVNAHCAANPTGAKA